MKLPFKKESTPVTRRRVPLEGRAPVYAYRASRSSEKSLVGRQIFRTALTAENASRALRYSMRRIGLITVLIAAVASAISVLIVSPDANVQLLDSQQGIFLHSTETYQQAAEKLLSKSLMDRTKITINTAAISAELEREFPELGVVSIKLPLISHRPIIYLMPTRPALLLTTINARSYTVNNVGRALGVVSPGDKALPFPLVTDESGLTVSIGQPALPQSTVAFIQAVVFQLQQKHLSASHFSLPASTDELDLYPTGVGYFVKFNLTDESTAMQQIGTFLAVRHYLQGEGVVPTQYIDARIVGRAYYK